MGRLGRLGITTFWDERVKGSGPELATTWYEALVNVEFLGTVPPRKEEKRRHPLSLAPPLGQRLVLWIVNSIVLLGFCFCFCFCFFDVSSHSEMSRKETKAEGYNMQKEDKELVTCTCINYFQVQIDVTTVGVTEIGISDQKT